MPLPCPVPEAHPLHHDTLPLAGRSAQRGFSLVELMVALVLGLLVVLAGFQLFTSLRQMSDDTRQLAERQSLLMGATEMLMQDLRTALAVEQPLPGESEVDTLTLRLDDARRVDYCAGQGSGPLSVDYAIETEENSNTDQLTLTLPASCQGGGTLMLGEASALSVTSLGAGHTFEITLTLEGESAPLVWRAVNRPLVVDATPANNEDA